ncbi:MAG TPA: hypothetical protein VG322_03355 [Candidatus Acidoferrales bacterium]|nr:hypothetical protein [Candidatus Acidoferrales bacterium]
MNGDAASAQYITFDSSCYPRTYPISLVWSLFFTALGIAVGVGLPYMILSVSGRGISISDNPSNLWLLPLPLGGICLMLWARRFKVTLQPDAIESQRLFSTRRLMRSEIKERRFVSGNRYGAFTQLVLVPRGGQSKELRIPLIIENDAVFDAWFAGIPMRARTGTQDCWPNS